MKQFMYFYFLLFFIVVSCGENSSQSILSTYLTNSKHLNVGIINVLKDNYNTINTLKVKELEENNYAGIYVLNEFSGELVYLLAIITNIMVCNEYIKIAQTHVTPGIRGNECHERMVNMSMDIITLTHTNITKQLEQIVKAEPNIDEIIVSTDDDTVKELAKKTVDIIKKYRQDMGKNLKIIEAKKSEKGI